MTAPHQLFLDDRRLCLTAVLVSLALSFWAIILDPVVNNDGTLYIKAAAHFAAGEWKDAFSIYKWPFYSIIIGAVSAITGLATGHSAYAVNAGLYVFLVLGFTAFVRSLGGGKAALWFALIVALCHPVLNEFRAFIIRDIGYWGCYLWSLAYFFSYLRHPGRQLLWGWAGFAVLAFLFRIEGVVVLVLLPCCLYAVKHRERFAAVLPAAAVGVGVMAAAPLWQHTSEIEASGRTLLAAPWSYLTESWYNAAAEILSRLSVVQREFPGIGSSLTALAVYLVTVLLLVLTELVKSLGIVFSGLAVYALVSTSQLIPDRTLRNWWWIIIGIQALLVSQFAFSNFFLAERYSVGLALTILVVVPLLFERFWADWKEKASLSWRTFVIAALLAVESLEGLNVATDKQYIKDAGLWLRGNAPSGSTLYSNNRILVYYAGLVEPRGRITYTWQEAMSEVWSDDWREYDYFALVMKASDARNEVLLHQKIGTDPVKTFDNEKGDVVLIFRPN